MIIQSKLSRTLSHYHSWPGFQARQTFPVFCYSPFLQTFSRSNHCIQQANGTVIHTAAKSCKLLAATLMTASANKAMVWDDTQVCGPSKNSFGVIEMKNKEPIWCINTAMEFPMRASPLFIQYDVPEQYGNCCVILVAHSNNHICGPFDYWSIGINSIDKTGIEHCDYYSKNHIWNKVVTFCLEDVYWAILGYIIQYVETRWYSRNWTALMFIRIATETPCRRNR